MFAHSSHISQTSPRAFLAAKNRLVIRGIGDTRWQKYCNLIDRATLGILHAQMSYLLWEKNLLELIF